MARSTRPRRPSVACRLVIVFVIGVELASMAPTTAGAAPGPQYRPPVEGVVVDPFRPPTGPFSSGNRGLEYETAPGAPVLASAAGRVVFAGPVGGALHVTVLHPDGLRTSYSFLRSVDVRVGAEVEGGDRVGTSSGRLHFGVRSGDTYLDPAPLLAGAVPRVRLVSAPVDGGVPAEGLALLAVTAGNLVGDASGPVGGTVELAAHYAYELQPAVRLSRVVREVSSSLHEDCTARSVEPSPPAGRRIAILIGGLGTTSERASVDRVETGALGYDAADVVRFSYRGGRTPAGPSTGPLSTLPATAYDAADSQSDLVEAADRLRALLLATAALQPGVPIDVFAHSQGGVVVQIALTDLATGPAIPPEVDLVVTMGSPHDGTDLATAAAGLHTGPRGREALDRLGRQLGLDADSEAIAQLAETSGLVEVLGRAPEPTGVRLLSVGARGDLTVPAGHTRLWDAPNPVIDLTGAHAHTLLPGDRATTRELALALDGRPPTCEPAFETLTDRAMAEGISWAEDAAGFTAWRMAG